MSHHRVPPGIVAYDSKTGTLFLNLLIFYHHSILFTKTELLNMSLEKIPLLANIKRRNLVSSTKEPSKRIPKRFSISITISISVQYFSHHQMTTLSILCCQSL